MMTQRYLSIVAYLCLISLVFEVKCHEGSTALKYDAGVFNEAVNTEAHFIMFFAPWCGHCKRLAPTWEQLAEKYNSDDEKHIKIAKVDCTIETSLCSEHDVTGYPTLKFFKPNQSPAVRYRGNRDLDALETFIREQMEKVEEKPEPPKIEVTHSLVELTDENFKSFVSEGDHFIKFYAPWCGHCQKLAPTWDALADSLKFDPTVRISKIDCTVYRPICQEFEVKGYPTLLWIKNGKTVERYQGGRTHEDLKDFVNKMKSSPEEADKSTDGKIPENDESSVVVLTSENFKNGIASGVTLVKFYAPWCGHCKRLAPTWEELSMKFFTNPTVTVADVDCTVEVNRELCKENNVDGYPTLILFKNGKKQDEYTGSRDLAALHSFVMNHINRDEL
ncbi:hypothetical protein CHUAL_004167 [Chamberlinius hualienensis]